MVGYIKGNEASSQVNLDVSMSFNVTESHASASGKADVTGATKTYDETHTTTTKKSSTTKVTEEHEKTVLVTTKVTEREEADTVVNTASVMWQDNGSNVCARSEGDDDADADTDTGTNTETNTNTDTGVRSSSKSISGRSPSTGIADEAVPVADTADENVPLANIIDEEVPLATILDDDVPLAGVPKTGDVSVMWYVMAALSAIGLSCLLTLEQKKRQES